MNASFALLLISVGVCAFGGILFLASSPPPAAVFLGGLAAAIAILVCTFKALGRLPRGEAAKVLLWGLMWIVGACWLWGGWFGNPMHELALIRYARTAPGAVVDAWEDVEEGDEGGHHWFYQLEYEYRLPDGRKLRGRTPDWSGRLPVELSNLPHPVEIEYLPYKPSVSRIKGTGHGDVAHWLVLSVCGGSLLLLLFLWPGVHLLRDGVRNLSQGDAAPPGHTPEDPPPG